MKIWIGLFVVVVVGCRNITKVVFKDDYCLLLLLPFLFVRKKQNDCYFVIIRCKYTRSFPRHYDKGWYMRWQYFPTISTSRAELKIMMFGFEYLSVVILNVFIFLFVRIFFLFARHISWKSGHKTSLKNPLAINAKLNKESPEKIVEHLFSMEFECQILGSFIKCYITGNLLRCWKRHRREINIWLEDQLSSIKKIRRKVT